MGFPSQSLCLFFIILVISRRAKEIIIVMMERTFIRAEEGDSMTMLYISHIVTAGRLNSFKSNGLLHQKPIIARIEPTVGKRLMAPLQPINEVENVNILKRMGTRICEVQGFLPR